MDSSPFLDAHSHQIQNLDHSVFHVINFDNLQTDIPSTSFSEEQNCVYSLGYHPWNFKNQNLSKEDMPELANNFINHFLEKDFYLLGEIGLDKIYKDSWDLQFAFLNNILAEFKNRNLKKPIVFHCVRAYQDLYQLIQKHNIESPIILHDFNGNNQMIEQFLRLNCYFSLGSQLFNTNSKLYKSVQAIPIERVLFETDDQNQLDIQAIYQQFIKLRKIELDDLKTSVIDNFLFILSNSGIKNAEGLIS